MVNIDEFIKRLEIILDYYSLSASSFADKIGVQRSSMSHLLSGRNKPSLDFILKIIDFFPDVDLYWILNGSGFFPKKGVEDENAVAPQNSDVPTPTNLFSQNLPSLQTKPVDEKNQQIKKAFENENSDEIEKIVFFYKNGTFKTFNPNS